MWMADVERALDNIEQDLMRANPQTMLQDTNAARNLLHKLKVTFTLMRGKVSKLRFDESDAVAHSTAHVVFNKDCYDFFLLIWILALQ